MLPFTLENAIESTIAEENVVIHYNNRDNRSVFYNPDNVPGDLLEKQVEFVETMPQHDGTTAICYTVYDY